MNPSPAGQQPRKISLWEVTGLPEDTNPKFVVGGTSRVTLAEAGDPDSHATSVAGIIASSGGGIQLPDYTSRGIAYKSELRTYTSINLPLTLDAAAGLGFRAGNQSIQQRAGFSLSDG